MLAAGLVVAEAPFAAFDAAFQLDVLLELQEADELHGFEHMSFALLPSPQRCFVFFRKSQNPVLHLSI